MTYTVAILCLWTISFLFAGIEAGLLSVDPVRLRHHVKQHRPAALRLDRLTKRPERLLITVLLVTNFANILGLLLLPKSLFRRFPFRALAALGGVLEGISILLWPVLEIGERAGRLFVHRRTAEP